MRTRTMAVTAACALAAWCAHATAVTQDAPPQPTAPPPTAPQPAAPAPPPHRPTTTGARPVAPVPPVPDLLSTAWLQRSLAMVADPDINAQGLEAMLSIALACGQLTPDRPGPWRIARLLADQLELTRPEVALPARRTALANLSRLEPYNDSITLARLTDAVESSGTAEERVRAYEHLLSDASASKLGPAVRSRLAYQLAMLQNRMGNTELFARWLAQAVKIDPSYPQAALAAAGFFRTRVDDPVADIELLGLAVTANPRDLNTLSALLSVLLDGGAFKGAERVARDALVIARDERQWPAINNFTCDLATALWGQGRRDEAKRELRNRLSVITDDYRKMLQYSDSTLTMERIKGIYPPLPSSLSVGMLALLDAGKESAEYERVLWQALTLTDEEITLLKKNGLAPYLDNLIDKAVISLLFSKKPDEVAELLKDCEKENLLNDAVQRRLGGMLKWNKHDYEGAVAELEPIHQTDTLARYAYACSLMELGKRQEAARELQALASEKVGTTIGLASLERLASVLGRDAVLTQQLSKEQAARSEALEKALAANLPAVIDEIAQRPNRVLLVNAEAVTNAAGDLPGPYTPLGVKVTIRNASSLPLSIGLTDPLYSQLVMRAELGFTGSAAAAASSKGAAGSTSAPERPIPQVNVPFDQGLELSPNESIQFVIDIANTPLGMRLAESPLASSLPSIAFVTNARDVGYGALPGFMGSTAAVAPFVVMGVTVTPEWTEESLKVIAGPASSASLARLSLLVHAAVAAPTPELWKAIVDAYGNLSPTEQAWIVAVMPDESPAMAPLMEAVRTSTSPEVLTSWMLCRVQDPKDPLLDVARRTGDPQLGRLADAASWIAERRKKRTIEELGVKDKPTNVPVSLPSGAYPAGKP